MKTKACLNILSMVVAINFLSMMFLRILQYHQNYNLPDNEKSRVFCEYFLLSLLLSFTKYSLSGSSLVLILISFLFYHFLWYKWKICNIWYKNFQYDNIWLYVRMIKMLLHFFKPLPLIKITLIVCSVPHRALKIPLNIFNKGSSN